MACQYDRNGRPQCQIVADPRTPNDFFCARCNTRFHKEIPGTAVNLAAILSKSRRTLLVEADPQGSASWWCDRHPQ